MQRSRLVNRHWSMDTPFIRHSYVEVYLKGVYMVVTLDTLDTINELTRLLATMVDTLV